MSYKDITCGYITVEEDLFRDGKVGVFGRYLYGFLRAILGDQQGVFSYREISKRTGMGEGRVRKAIKDLEERGYLYRDYVFFRVDERTFFLPLYTRR